MSYPYKYCLIVDYDEPYTGGTSQFFYCDYADAEADYIFYTEEDGRKCVLYRLLKYDNFDL